MYTPVNVEGTMRSTTASLNGSITSGGTERTTLSEEGSYTSNGGGGGGSSCGFIGGHFRQRSDLDDDDDDVATNDDWYSKFNTDSIGEIYDLPDGNRIVLNRELGSGQYGVVYHGILEVNDNPPIDVAIKKLKCEKVIDIDMLADFEREIKIMKVC